MPSDTTALTSKEMLYQVLEKTLVDEELGDWEGLLALADVYEEEGSRLASGIREMVASQARPNDCERSRTWDWWEGQSVKVPVCAIVGGWLYNRLTGHRPYNRYGFKEYPSLQAAVEAYARAVVEEPDAK